MIAFLDYLNRYSNLVVGMATVVLVAVTWWYVRLTKQVVDTNREQLADLREQRAASDLRLRRYLASVADRIVRCLEELPVGPRDNPDQKMRRATLWTEDDVQQVEITSAGLEPDVAAKAASATKSTLWLLTWVGRVRAVEPRQGYDWRAFPWEDWQRKLATALDGLRAVCNACGQQGPARTTGGASD